MTYADHIAKVALGLMSDPAFVMTATLYSNTANKDAYGNPLKPSHAAGISINGFFNETPNAKTIDAKGVERHLSARFYTYDVTTVIKLKDKLAYGGMTYNIIDIATPELAGKKAYRYLDLQLSKAKF